MLRELTKVEFWSLCIGQKEGQEAAALNQGIEIIIGTRIQKGEAEAEVGGSMTVITTVEETEITVIGAEAAALITTKVVGEVNMMRRGAAEVGLMEVPPLLAVAPVLEGALLHVEQPLLGMLVQMDVITRTVLQLQRVSHRGLDVLVLAAPCRVLMLMTKEQGWRPWL